MTTIARASEQHLPPEERRSIHAAHVDTRAETGAHPTVADHADTDVILTAEEQQAVDEWAGQMESDLPPIRADVNGCCAPDTGHRGGVYPAPVAPSFGFMFWAGLFLRALWPVLAIAVVFVALWLWHGRHAIPSAS